MSRKASNIWDNFKWLWQEGKKLGFWGILKALWEDLVKNRSLSQWLYLLALSFPTLVLEFIGGTRHIAGFAAALTGILCVIFVAEGRISNYFIGFIHEMLYLYLSFENMYYGEVLTTLFFTVMQFVGAYYWLIGHREVQEKKVEVKDVKSRKLTPLGWLKSLGITIIVWLVFGFIYRSIGSHRPFWDSSTDGTNWSGQFLQTGMYSEQWLFWIATNVLSIFLWWGAEPHVMLMYIIYMINSIVGWVKWERDLRITQEQLA